MKTLMTLLVLLHSGCSALDELTGTDDLRVEGDNNTVYQGGDFEVAPVREAPLPEEEEEEVEEVVL